MKFLTTLISVLIVQSTFSQDFWSKKLDAFHALAIQGRMQVFLTQGAEYKVEANVNDEEVDMENLIFSNKDGALKIRYQGGAFKDVDLVLTIYVPSGIDLEANQGVEIRTKGSFVLAKDELKLECFAGGKMAVSVQSKKVTSSIHQGGSIRITGYTLDLDASVFTGGTIATTSLHANTVHAKVNMGGEIITSAIDLLDAYVGSGGTISYKGEPKKIEQKVVLGGKIEKL